MSKDRKRLTLDELGKTCARIEKILAGQNVTLADIVLPQDRDPRETPLERLQAFKALLNETLAELERGEGRCCRTCGKPLPDNELDEMPWAFRCNSAAGCHPPERE